MGSEISAVLSSRNLLVTQKDDKNPDSERVPSKINQLVRDEYGRMIGYARKKLESAAEQDAEDIVQDVFYSLINRPDFTAPIENIVSYLYQSLRNRIIDFWRVRKRNQSLDTTQDDESSTTLLDIISDNRYSSDESINQREMKALLKEALSQLKSDERSVVVATEIHGYSFNELSTLWNSPLNTLLSRKSRAMKKIQEWVQKNRDTTGNSVSNI